MTEREQGITDEQFNSFLELIALNAERAQSVEEAVAAIRQGKVKVSEAGEDEPGDNGMTNEQFNIFLELIALNAERAKSVEEAVAVIRKSKVEVKRDEEDEKEHNITDADKFLVTMLIKAILEIVETSKDTEEAAEKIRDIANLK